MAMHCSAFDTRNRQNTPSFKHKYSTHSRVVSGSSGDHDMFSFYRACAFLLHYTVACSSIISPVVDLIRIYAVVLVLATSRIVIFTPLLTDESHPKTTKNNAFPYLTSKPQYSCSRPELEHTKAMAANHLRVTLFDLPMEIRLQIWADTILPRNFTMADGGTLIERSVSVHRYVNICQESRYETRRLIEAVDARFVPMQDAVYLPLDTAFSLDGWLGLWTVVHGNSNADIRMLIFDHIKLSRRASGIQRRSEVILKRLAVLPALEQVTVELVSRGKSRSTRYAGMSRANKPYAVLRQKTLEKALAQIATLLKDEESKHATWKAPKVKLSQLS